MAIRRFVYIDDVEGVAAEQDAGDELVLGRLTATGVGGIAVDAANARLVNLSLPSGNQDATNKSYVDAIIQRLDQKTAPRALADSQITLSGVPVSVDGVIDWVDGDRILLTGQNDPLENGFWLVRPGAWERPVDFAVGFDVSSAFTFVERGTIYADTGWLCTTNAPTALVGTHGLAWAQFGSKDLITFQKLWVTVEAIGPKDGVNTVFTAPDVFRVTTLAVYANGLALLQGVGNDYTVSESGGVGTGYDTVTLAFSPIAEDNLLLSYVVTL